MKKLSTPSRVLVGLSGGLDSAVVAALLKNQGYEVIGAHLEFPQDPETLSPPPRDAADDDEGERVDFRGHCTRRIQNKSVQAIADRIGIPLHFVPAQGMFEDQVVDYCVHEALLQRVPLPCVPCHRNVRFRLLFETAEKLRCSFVATGHSAQVLQDQASGLARLLRSSEAVKDQSFFLFSLTQPELQRILMPLGALPDALIRKVGAELGLGPEVIKSFSGAMAGQDAVGGACFVDSGDFPRMVRSRVAPSLRVKGIIRSTSGDIVGEHFGLYAFRLGQKTGFKLTVKNPEAYHVVGFDVNHQILMVGTEEIPSQSQALASKVTWVRPRGAAAELHGIQCVARLSPHGEPQACRVTLFEAGRVHIEFNEPQNRILPGQPIVFYDGEEILGGAWLDQFAGGAGK